MQLTDNQKSFLLNLLNNVTFTVDQADLDTEIKQLKDFLVQDQATIKAAQEQQLEGVAVTETSQPVTV